MAGYSGVKPKKFLLCKISGQLLLKKKINIDAKAVTSEDDI